MQFFEGQGSPCVHLALFVGHRLFSRGCRSLQTLRKVNRAQDVDSIPSGVPEITTDFLPLRLASVTCRADRDTSRNPHRQLQAENDEQEKQARIRRKEKPARITRKEKQARIRRKEKPARITRKEKQARIRRKEKQPKQTKNNKKNLQRGGGCGGGAAEVALLPDITMLRCHFLQRQNFQRKSLLRTLHVRKGSKITEI